MPPLLAALVLSAVHLFAGKLTFLETIPRSRWLSIAGGVSVAYVFVHLLPELQRVQSTFDAGEPFSWLEHHAYLLSMMGLTLFYGVERGVRQAVRRGGEITGRIFWLHIVSFAVYNALFGYTLREEADPVFMLGIGLHFVVNDFGLRMAHPQTYHRLGRWLLSAAVLAGYLFGRVAPVHELATQAVLGFLSGGIVLNVLKEELPDERESRFGWFAAGAAAFAAILLLAAG